MSAITVFKERYREEFRNMSAKFEDVNDPAEYF